MENIIANAQIYWHRVTRALNFSDRAIQAVWVKHVLLSLLFIMPLMHIQGQEKIPKKALKYFALADYDIGLGLLETARDNLKLAIKAYPDYSKAHLYLGDIHFQFKDYEGNLVNFNGIENFMEFRIHTMNAPGKYDPGVIN